MFRLHPRLLKETHSLGRLPLCELLLMDEATYPWFILVPRRSGVREIFELESADQNQLLAESSALSRVLVELFAPDKLNLGALGNIVPQLHLHHVVRYRTDPAWPAPVWGRSAPVPYDEAGLRRMTHRLAGRLEGLVPTEE